MKKAGLYGAIILWVLISGRYLSSERQTQTVSLGMAFESSAGGEGWEELNTYIEGYGEFGVCYLSGQEKEKLVRDIAAAIGITSPFDIATTERSRQADTADSENTQSAAYAQSAKASGNGPRIEGDVGAAAVAGTKIITTTLTKSSINGDVVVKSITDERRQEDGSFVDVQYVYVKITAYNNAACAGDYRELLEGLFDAMGIKGNVNVNLVGSLKGALNRDEKNALADELLYELDAKVATENRESDMFTVYAYSEEILPYITIGKTKINVNIAINYDEEKNRTNVYLASPVSSLDY